MSEHFCACEQLQVYMGMCKLVYLYVIVKDKGHWVSYFLRYHPTSFFLFLFFSQIGSLSLGPRLANLDQLASH